MPADDTKPPVIAIMGPTASGKTDLAIALCKALPCDIISVDSALVYRGMDIGSAKPTPAELEQAPHRLIDICDPAEPYSAADFARDAEKEIAAIHAQERIPVLVGGTMLYFRALFEGLSPMPASDPQVRQAIELEAVEHGWPYMHEQLRKADPECAARLHPNHSQRISRALEVFRISGKTMTSWQGEQSQGLKSKVNVCQLALLPQDRKVLHDRIANRFDKMLQMGFIEEVRSLFERGDLHPDLPSIRAVGYRQVWEFLAGQCDYEEMREKGVAATRQLAKRQMTWLRSWPGVHVIETLDENSQALTINEILAKALNILKQSAI